MDLRCVQNESEVCSFPKYHRLNKKTAIAMINTSGFYLQGILFVFENKSCGNVKKIQMFLSGVQMVLSHVENTYNFHSNIYFLVAT